MTAISTALSGLQASTTRLLASASNVANAQTRGPVPATPPTEPVRPRAPAARTAQETPQVYQAVETVQTEREDKGGVRAVHKPTVPSYIPEYDPDSAYADADGLVAAPNVDEVGELVNQMEALRSYRANMATVRTSIEMDESTVSLQS